MPMEIQDEDSHDTDSDTDSNACRLNLYFLWTPLGSLIERSPDDDLRGQNEGGVVNCLGILNFLGWGMPGQGPLRKNIPFYRAEDGKLLLNMV
jgi:hypothetical protein